ncbi:MAG: Na+/H+ antiporter subunit E [Desulfobacterales bacterium]|nr:Na+/H+ antiporter subunit E [Desulfobacterales bacterium]
MTAEKQKNHQNAPAFSQDTEDPPVRSQPKKNVLPHILTFIIMFSVWILFSGKFDRFHISLGIISCALVSVFGSELLFPDLKIKELPIVWFRFIRYVPWLLYQVLVANIHVMYLAFHPKMIDLIDPQIIVFRSRLKSDLSLVTLANSITLTPGTITVYVSIFGDVTVHAIDVESGQSLPWIMDARIAEIFGE